MRHGRAPRRAAQGGFTYFGVLVLVVLIGLMLAAAGEVAGQQAQREREAQLLFIGHQYRDAIERYFQMNHRFPARLDDLVSDTSGALAVTHYLRKRYQDPMAPGADWIVIGAAEGGVQGVASSSTRTTIKRAGFDPVDVDFDKAERYSDWAFVYDPLRGLRSPLGRPTTYTPYLLPTSPFPGR
jgi:type II secretory pathway pseudopilin PulG